MFSLSKSNIFLFCVQENAGQTYILVCIYIQYTYNIYIYNKVQ